MMADSNKNVHQQQPDEKESTPESENIAVAAARGTFLSFILKFVSFGTSQIIFRVVDPTTLGTASIQFELLLNTALFLSREGFRLALIRQSSTEKINNVIWLTLPMGLALSVFAFGIHFYSCSRQNYGYYYELTGSLYCISAFIETLAEPLLIQCCFMNTTSFRNMNSRAYAEGTATLLKGISCVYFLLSFSDTTDSNNIDVLAFGYSQLVYAIAFSSIMYHRLWNQIIWPISTSLDYQTIYMVFVFTIQGIFKHLLTEGDRIILTALASGYDKGVYAMTSSYGGLVSRLVFSSLEENARLLFSRQAATLTSSQEAEKQKIKKEIELVYCTILKLVLYIGFTFAFLATNYSHVLLSILTSGRGGGSKWGLPFQTEASDALSAFCIYTAFLALNGTTEAFVYGVASHGTDVGKLGISHAFVGAIFAITGPILVKRWGTIGLVAANSLGMALRSIYSITFATKYFDSVTTLKTEKGDRNEKKNKNKGGRSSGATLWRLMKQFTPHIYVTCLYIISFCITYFSQKRMMKNLHMLLDQSEHGGEQFNLNFFRNRGWLKLALQHVSVGAACFCTIVITIFHYEKDFGSHLKSFIRRPTKEKGD